MRFRYVLALALTILTVPTARAQEDSPHFQAIRTLERVFMSGDSSSLEAFLESGVAAAWRERVGDAAIREQVSLIREAARAAQGLDVQPRSDGVRFLFEGDDILTVDIDLDGTARVTGLAVERGDGSDQGPPPEVRLRLGALEQLGSDFSPQALEQFESQHLTEGLRQQGDRAELERIGRAFAAAGGIAVSPSPEGFRIELEGEGITIIDVRLEGAEPFRISSLNVEEGARSEDGEVPEMTWESLGEQLAGAEANGFSGVVLAVRGGEFVLHEAYGLANREAGTPLTTASVFGIGSTPIDFTTAGILLLAQRGVLSLDQSITDFIDGVPQDKVSITIDQLLSGRSGLANFHHDPTVDADYDLTWIDRAEAVRRIMAGPLLFEPGSDYSHSHSAFGLLAAIIEIATGSSYGEFLQQEIFAPAGMTSTGFYGPDSGIDPARMATGYGGSRVGSPNIPANWGPTSWLVMGSGGMVSTPMDLYHLAHFMPTVLDQDLLARFQHEGPLAGGSDRGFFVMYVTAPDAEIYAMTNTDGPGTPGKPVARALMQLALSRVSE